MDPIVRSINNTRAYVLYAGSLVLYQHWGIAVVCISAVACMATACRGLPIPASVIGRHDNERVEENVASDDSRNHTLIESLHCLSLDAFQRILYNHELCLNIIIK